jgi:hypothetical protein
VHSRGVGNVVYKAFSATQQEWRETRLIKLEGIELLHEVRHAPVTFQEYIDANVDLRIIIIGDHVFPAAITRSKLTIPSTVEWISDGRELRRRSCLIMLCACAVS